MSLLLECVRELEGSLVALPDLNLRGKTNISLMRKSILQEAFTARMRSPHNTVPFHSERI